MEELSIKKLNKKNKGNTHIDPSLICCLPLYPVVVMMNCHSKIIKENSKYTKDTIWKYIASNVFVVVALLSIRFFGSMGGYNPDKIEYIFFDAIYASILGTCLILIHPGLRSIYAFCYNKLFEDKMANPTQCIYEVKFKTCFGTIINLIPLLQCFVGMIVLKVFSYSLPPYKYLYCICTFALFVTVCCSFIHPCKQICKEKYEHVNQNDLDGNSSDSEVEVMRWGEYASPGE
jgi:hypothetical protein